jgi:hypothetical protein
VNNRYIYFDDLLDGVDVLEGHLADGNLKSAANVIEKMLGDIGEAQGGAADHLRYILYTGVDNWRPIQIPELREAVNVLAVDSATASNIESGKQTKARANTLKRNTRNRRGEWQELANKLSTTTTATNRNWKKIDCAKQIKKELKLTQTAKHIASKIKKPS